MQFCLGKGFTVCGMQKNCAQFLPFKKKISFKLENNKNDELIEQSFKSENG